MKKNIILLLPLLISLSLLGSGCKSDSISFTNGEIECNVCNFQLDLEMLEMKGNSKLLYYVKKGTLQKHGPYNAWYDNNKTLLRDCGCFEEGQKVGKWKIWYENGSLEAECFYIAGKLQGRFTSWHQNGIIQAEGYYLSGISVGVWWYYNENGICISGLDYGAQGTDSPSQVQCR